MTKRFDVQFLEEASNFLDSIEAKAREKIIYNIKKSQVVNNNELFKKLTHEIWEFRTLHKRTYYRLFAFWDKTDKTKTLVISSHGIVKKMGKTPKAEIEKTLKIKHEYFLIKNNKQHSNENI